MQISRRAFAALAGAALLTSACGGGGSTPTAASSSQSTAPASASASASDTSAPAASPSDSGAPARANADLVIWTDDTKQPTIKAVADKFGAANGITVAVQVISKDLQATVVAANQAGNGPDVFTGAHDWIGNLVQNGTIEPLTLTPAQMSAYSDVAVKAVTYNGKVMGLPFGQESIALFRNTAVAPDAPKTLDDAFTTGLAAVKAKKVESAFDLQQGPDGDAYHMEPVFTSAGGYLFGRDSAGNYNPKDLGLGSATGLAAAKKIGSLGEKGTGILRRSISGDNSIALFAAGKAAYLISGPWAINDVTKGGVKYAVSAIPPLASGKPAKPFAGVQSFFVAAGGKNKAFAQEFVTNAMNTEDAMKGLYEGAKIPPSMKSVQATVASDPLVKPFLDASNGGDAMPAIPAMQEVWAPLGKAYSAIVGGADPTTTMSTTAKTIADAIAAKS